MDIFEEYLRKTDNELVRRALTDRSYQAYLREKVKKDDPNHFAVNQPIPTNFKMATFGDTVLKMFITEHIWDMSANPTAERALLESDLVLVEVIGRHYEILNFMHYHETDRNIPHHYNYLSFKQRERNRCKFIATCVEAMIAAIYLDAEENAQKLKKLIATVWIPMIRNSEVYKDKREENHARQL